MGILYFNLGIWLLGSVYLSDARKCFLQRTDGQYSSTRTCVRLGGHGQGSSLSYPYFRICGRRVYIRDTAESGQAQVDDTLGHTAHRSGNSGCGYPRFYSRFISGADITGGDKLYSFHAVQYVQTGSGNHDGDYIRDKSRSPNRSRTRKGNSPLE